MGIGTHRVQVIKDESTANGGTDGDAGLYGGPAPIEAQEDALESAGIYFQDATVRDENVYIARAGDDMIFRDVTTGSEVTLTSLIGGAAATDHGTLLGLGDDDHPQYQLRTEKNAANGYAPLDGSSLLPLANLPGHGTTHIQGGSDELVMHQLGAGATAEGLFAVTDGLGGWVLQTAPGEAFGTQLASAVDDTLLSTTSTTFVNKLTLNVTGLPTGDYILFYKTTLLGSANGTKGESQVTQDATIVHDTQVLIAGAADSEQAFTGLQVLYSLSGSHSFEIDIRKISGAGEMQAKITKLVLFRVA